MGLPASISTPNFDTAMIAVPTSLTDVPGASLSKDTYIVCYLFANPTAAAITIQVTDTAGDVVIPTFEMAPNYILPIELPFQHVKGLKWIASASGLMGQIWGFQ